MRTYLRKITEFDTFSTNSISVGFLGFLVSPYTVQNYWIYLHKIKIPYTILMLIQHTPSSHIILVETESLCTGLTLAEM